MLQPLQDIEGWIFMSRIQETFLNQKPLIGFVTGGDPDLETTEQLLLTMAESDVDMIEVGIPFSDPTAEGPVFQAANERALKAGCTVDGIFEVIAKVRQKVSIPILFVTYANPIYVYGKERFMKRCQDVQVDGILIPDVPFEEKEEFLEVCKEYKVELISIIAPASKERMEKIMKEAKGFFYGISSFKAIAENPEEQKRILEMVSHAKEINAIPCAIDFDIFTPEQAKIVAPLCDGVIVGSAIVKILEEHGKNAVPLVGTFLKEMKQVIESV